MTDRPMLDQQNKRRFNRVCFEADALLVVDDKYFESEVMDLSLHGVRLRLKTKHQCDHKTLYRLQILLGAGLCAINIHGRPRFQNRDEVGLEIEEMDIDSATHLRRILDLNLGDPRLVERDFEALIFG